MTQINAFSLILLLLLSIETNADMVSITFLKGKAIYVSPSGKRFDLKKNQKIKRDGLVKTGKSSLLRLKFSNGTLLNIGPESSMVISHEEKEKPHLVELIRGKLRGVVDPKQKPSAGYDHKMIIKTRSASIGVRGTDFVVVHNDKNHITSNITLKGEVDLHKNPDEIIYESLREELDPSQRPISFGQRENLEATEEDLRNYRTKRIPVGHFAGAFPSYESAISPVKIADNQLMALGKNTNLDSSEGKRPERILTNNYKMGNLKNPESSLIPEPQRAENLNKEKYNSVTNEAGIRHGGIVDLETGIYISPPKNSTYNPETGKHMIPDELGGVNPDTGEYVPPRGVKLDPLYGFKYDSSIPADRNVKENLQKLQNLTGTFTEKVSEALEIFKEITRLDLYGFANYQYTTNVREDYYGEYRRITNKDSMLWNLEGFAGFQLFHNKDWLIYPKGSVRFRYYESSQPDIRELNQYEGMIGNEIHYKHLTFGRRSRLIFDVAFTTRYQNYQKRDLYDFYTEDTGLKIMERLSLNRNNHLNLYYQIRAFHGYRDPDHGNIHNFGLNHDFELGDTWSLLYGAEWSWRDNKLDNNTYEILAGHLKFKWREILSRSDLTFGYTYQNHQTRIPLYFDHAVYYKGDILFHRNLGKFWKINLLYEYERMRSYGASLTNDRRTFIRQSWGGGLTMVF